jgi:ABC-type transport system substrate-binding protein
VACALDQELLIEEGYRGYAEVAQGWVPQDMEQWFNPNLTDYREYGPEDGKELLQEAGFTIRDDTVYYPEGEVPSEEEKNKVYEGYEG